jgi:tetratricopeptide (TPR) repeat protein
MRDSELHDVNRPQTGERTAARALLDELLCGPASWWRTRVLNTPDTLTREFVLELIGRSVILLDTSPADAVVAAEIAVEIAQRLDVPGIRANACRELAYALFYIGRLNEAETAVDQAEELFRQLPEGEIELARTALIRASLLRARDQVAEAIGLARNAAGVFERCGDRPRYLKARMVEGNLRYQSGDVSGALAIWLELEDEAPADTLGLLLHNIGHAYRDLHDFTSARSYFDRAVAEYASRGMEVETIRTRWVLGQMLILAGTPSEGLPILHAARRDFERLGMELEAALVGLELAEALLIAGQIDQVARICRTILDRFVKEGMMSRAITALAYLREAVAAEKATPTMVRQVREFLQLLPEGRDGFVLPLF